MSQQPSSLIFLHIPKTAGTTVRSMLNHLYVPQSIYAIGKQTTATHFVNLPAEQQQAYRVLMGHMDFGLHVYLTPPVRYFTFLREPVDRTISAYYFLYRLDDHPERIFAEKHAPTFAEFLQHPRFITYDNLQTRMLSGIGVNVPYGEVTSEHVAQAKANIEQWFDVTGLAERFDETLLLLQRTYGWKWIYYASLNVTHKRPKSRAIDERTRELILARNQQDIELYTWVKQRFEQRINNLGDDFQKDVARFRRHNTLVAPILRTYWNARKTFDLKFIRDVWHRLNRST